MINRFVFKQLQEEIRQPEILILLGPRQVGKTTLLKMLEDEAKKQGRQTAFFDLEQPQILAEFNRPNHEIIEKIRSSGNVVFIDEFQYLENASKIFKALYDSKTKIKLICSGSSSLEIHKHLKESLAGRRFLYRVFPLQFAEIKQNDKNYNLQTYLRFGGMPALTHTDSEERKQVILSELLSAYILKDIKALIREENIRAFNHLLYLLAQYQGSLISVHSLAQEINMSVNALNRYLDILDQTFSIVRIFSFSTNLGNELKKSSKIYLYDLGIRNALLKDFSAIKDRSDNGILFESFVGLKLHQMLKPNMELKFWRTKDSSEVDFILLRNRKPFPFEVKTHLNRMEIPSGLKRFLLRYPKTKRAFVINENQEGILKLEETEIRFIPLESFAFLEDSSFLES
ncbi:MAG: ATP-binding protein [Candidatus Omnitrophica bacterium]|nr:ATP-binding protein [Candidatus Omnitrophota bacterium]